jgi:hypothetical protein
VEMLSNTKKKNLGVHKDGKNKTYGRNKISIPRSTSMYPILFSFSCSKNENLPPIKY